MKKLLQMGAKLFIKSNHHSEKVFEVFVFQKITSLIKMETNIYSP